jgi:protein-disulfide isomerase
MTSSAAPPKLEGAAASKAATTTGAQDDPKAQFEAWWNAQPRIETGVPLDGAKVVIVKFSDFQCPGCKQTWLMYSPILKKYEDKGSQVRYVMKDFPLNSNCNVAVQTQMHPFSCEASTAYRGAADRGKGEAMEKWIFDNQATLTSANIRQAAKDIAGITDFDREVSLRMASIKKDTADGGALQISSTPTFFINGVKLPTGQWLNPDYFDLAIQIELKRAGVAAPQKAGGE